MLMQAKELVNRLEELDMPVFTTADAANLAGKSTVYMKVFLAGLTKQDVIEKVERGKYCLKGTSAYVIASRITKKSYVALISAARFHGITAQLPNSILVFSVTYHRQMRIGEYLVKFIKVNSKVMYGFREYNGAYVSEIEKIFVDDVYYHKRLTYDEELESALARDILDTEKLYEYAKMLGGKAVAARLHDSIANAGNYKGRLHA